MAVYKATAGFPREEQFGLTAQVRRAAVSAPSDIVEGCSRSTEKDFLRFLEIAHGSLREAGYQLSIAFRLGYLDEPSYLSLHDCYQRAAKALAAFINRIRTDE